MPEGGQQDRPGLQIAPFQASDQAEVKALVLQGLQEHWGQLDPKLNPDLNDIATAYASGLFLVGRVSGVIRACGAFLPLGEDQAQVSRVSVHPSARRQGLGSQILEALISAARAKGYQELVLETTASWHEARAFYLKLGFEVSHYEGDDLYFRFSL